MKTAAVPVGHAVLSAESLALLPVDAAAVGTPGALTPVPHRIDWVSVAHNASAQSRPVYADALENLAPDEPVPDVVAVSIPPGRGAAALTLDLVREWLDQKRFADAPTASTRRRRPPAGSGTCFAPVDPAPGLVWRWAGGLSRLRGCGRGPSVPPGPWTEKCPA
ncbi:MULTISPECIES: hypothetical protein [unclassified Streptomyces]|uniref:hypothetical protein n=1 Tax=unclassified Streptomyces TaxID=2593676 RepID=UPI0008052D3A|nr:MULTISPECIES: hypothetical protein [unclassified Streptomyces]MYR70869.1 hypothetical protein [Streptomyces sp. SID4925]SBV01819.1 hypothetical protein YUMDRAFT_06557 [Streptomyces sp. OspMP-M45]